MLRGKNAFRHRIIPPIDATEPLMASDP